MTERLELLGVGLAMPPAQPVRDLIRAGGGDPELHDGWDHACIAADDEHPSTMASAALGEALTQAGVEAAQLDLVLAVGVSRDYPASWSTAAEVMRLQGTSSACIGFDLTVGCLGTLVGLNTALGWLHGMGGGYAAIVTAERWTQTIARTNPEHKALWGHSDGGGAIVVSVDRPGRSLSTFRGAAFANHHAFNGLVRMKYGGTRFPTAPPGEAAAVRTLTAPAKEIWAAYADGYVRAFTALQRRFAIAPARLVCNQISPNIVTMITGVVGLAEDRVCRSGHAYGHVGGADVMIGLHELAQREQLDGPVVIAASAPYAFGVGVLTPPHAAS